MSPEQQRNRFERLRAQALALIARGGTAPAELPSDVHALIEETQILQAELEVQTEELRRSQEATELARRHYFSVFEQAPAGLLLLDADLKIRERNRRVRELLGTDPLSQSFVHYITPDSIPTLERTIQQVAEGETLSVELRIRQLGGSRFSGQVSISPWRESGEKHGYLLGILDVTPLRTAEREQHALAHRYRTLFESARDALVVVDDLTKTIVEVNGAFCTLVARPFDALIGVHLESLFPRDRAVLYRLIIEQLPDHVAAPPAELVLVDAEGREIVVDVTVGRRENPPALVVQARDAAPRRALESQREVAREAQSRTEKLEAVGRVAGSVAHEMNNVLTTVSSTAAALESADSLMEALGAADALTRTVERGRDLTRGLLALTGRNSARPERFSMTETLVEVQRQVRPLFPTGVGFTLDLEAGGEVELMGDVGLWRQALVSLIYFARESIEHEGKVRVLLAADARTIRLEISDDGRVLSPEEQAGAFEPFLSRKPVRASPGLGLALVKAVVRMHHAELTMTPGASRGTTVRIVIPRTPIVSASESVEDVGPVLVVDDDDDVRRAIVRMLRKRGFDVREAGSAEAAVERIAGEEIGVVLTDLNMPGADGLWLCRRLRGDRRDVAVLVATGLADESLRRELAELRVGLLEKPFSAEDLVGAIRRSRVVN